MLIETAYNLGWKIALVAKGICKPEILKTYQSERRRVAQDLIEFDHRFSRLFSGRPAKDLMDEEGISIEDFKAAIQKGHLFTTGIGVDYGASMIVAKSGDTAAQGDGTDVSARGKTTREIVGKQHLSSVIKLGMRFPSFPVLNQADARQWHFQERLPSDGRWRIIVFAGDVKQPEQAARMQELGKALARPDSFLRRYTPEDAPIDSVIEVLTIHSSPRRSVELTDFHEIFRPFRKGLGWDYWKIYVDDEPYHQEHGQAYRRYDVDAKRGCLVLLRPDMHVSWMGELEDVEELEEFLDRFMLNA